MEFSLLTDVSRETSDRLTHYLELIRKWNPKINLVAPSTIDDAASRHFADSAQAYRLVPSDATRLVDIGSGGGFPGLVLAILAAADRPDLKVTLIESDQRKAAFLRTVARETGVKVDVLAKRIEEVPSLNCDVLSARALAPLPLLCQFASHHLASTGTALFLKGKSWGKEVEDALLQWKFSYTAHTSVTEPTSVVLELRDLSHE